MNYNDIEKVGMFIHTTLCPCAWVVVEAKSIQRKIFKSFASLFLTNFFHILGSASNSMYIFSCYFPHFICLEKEA